MVSPKYPKWGRNWKTDSSEKQFTKSDVEGRLEKAGSSRWRQRAFYDFLRDVVTQSLAIPLYRFSIYDQIDSTTLGKLLAAKQVNKKLILDYVSGKIGLDYRIS